MLLQVFQSSSEKMSSPEVCLFNLYVKWPKLNWPKQSLSGLALRYSLNS